MRLNFEQTCILVDNNRISVLNMLQYWNFKIYSLETGDMMILKTEQDLTCNDIEVLIRYAKMNGRVEKLITLMQSVDTQLKCNSENSERLINTSDIFYIESVDKKTFVYLEENVYRTDLRLYQLVEYLEHLGFVQISKSCILNINTLESIKSLTNSRMEATLKNGEKLHITRKYLKDIKQALQGGINI